VISIPTLSNSLIAELATLELTISPTIAILFPFKSPKISSRVK